MTAAASMPTENDEVCTCLCVSCAEYAGCAACPDCASGCGSCGYDDEVIDIGAYLKEVADRARRPAPAAARTGFRANPVIIDDPDPDPDDRRAA